VKKRLIIVGGTGPGQIASAVFEDMNKINDEWIVEGFLNDVMQPGEYFGKYKVLGASQELSDFIAKEYCIHYALHINAKAKEQRVNWIKDMKIPNELLATAIHPTAYIMEGTIIGAGSLLAPYAITSFGAKIGMYCHVYSNAFLGHDCDIKDYATIAAKSVVGARVIVDEGAHVGLNSCLREDIIIGKYSIVGMGAVVINNMEPYTIYVGNPAKMIGNVKK